MKRLHREFSSGGLVIRLRGSGVRILLIKDPYGKWTWPKGKIDKGETPLDAALREIREETGLRKIKMVDQIGKVNYFYSRKKKLIYKTVYVYVFRATGSEKLVIQKEEIDDGKWLTSREAFSRLAYKGAKEMLRKALRAFKEVEA